MISFLLAPDANTPPAVVTRAGIGAAFTLLFSRTVIQELTEKVKTKP